MSGATVIMGSSHSEAIVKVRTSQEFTFDIHIAPRTVAVGHAVEQSAEKMGVS